MRESILFRTPSAGDALVVRLALLLCLLGLTPARAAPSSGGAQATARALSDAFADVAARVAPTTVYVQAEKARPLSSGLQQLARDYALPATGADGPAFKASTGSGVIVRSDGLVLTNHHVVNGATAITVILHDKRHFDATLLGSDPRTDVALLRIDAGGPLPAASIGDSDAVRVGEWVIAIGHPFDFEFSVTAGIVSARGRRNLAKDLIQDFIQTDAAMNPGSSGGPLFNLDGEVIGINTAIYTPTGGAAQSAGISFAIPSNMAWRIAQELMGTGRVVRAGIGVTTRDSPATADDPRPGAEVTRVAPGGPAERAGLLRGDMIISVDCEAVSSSQDLRGIVLAAGAGVELTVGYERGDRVSEAPVVTGDERAIGMVDVVIPTGAVEWGGLTLAEATDERTALFGAALPPRTHPGLIVLAVEPGSSGAQAGLLPGDVLLEVQTGDFADAAEFLGRVTGHRSVAVTFWRGEGRAVAVLGGL